MLEKQEKKKYNDLKKEILIQINKNNSDIQLKRKKKYGNLYVIIKCLEFLPLNKNILNLLLVSKNWNQKLYKKIYKLFLLKNIENDFLKKKRIEIWLSVLKYVYKIKYEILI